MLDKDTIKKSLNMPQTAFEMKANLNIKEPKIQEKWVAENVYKNVLKNNENKQQFILHDGPPYANGDLHIGHSLNIILKDIIVRYKNAKGFYSPFVLGWDCHGLPIEHAISKKMGPEYNKLSAVEKRKLCYDYAIAQTEKQKEQFKKFGLFTDLNVIYKTLDRDFENRQLDLFFNMLENKYVYQAFKPVHWSWSSQTALAEGELEYKELEAHSIYVSFNVVDGKNILEKNDNIIIWTTTPWTLPSNLAVAVNPEFNYVKVKVKDKNYVVSEKLLDKIANVLKWKDFEIVKKFNGRDLEYVKYQHPLVDKQCPIILAEYVTIDDGTGLVHNAPGFGNDDYFACKKYNIDVYCPIDKYGKFTDEVKQLGLAGIFYEQANESIIKMLEQKNVLLNHSLFKHSAAVDWRTKKPIIFRATKQWFIDISKIKAQILKHLKNVKFQNESSKIHMEKMIQGRQEWCISRQRVWGAPICVIYDSKLNPIFDSELNKNIYSILSKEGTNAWFEKPVEYFLTEKYKNKKDLIKCLDTMDVWFDSGSSHLMFKDTNLNYPIDLYLEGNDQYRGWFNSSLITSVIVNDFSPYKQLVSHGMVVDEQGRKMSKSLGNVVNPNDVVKKYGTDILRIWVANNNYTADIAISENILKQTAEIYRRIRNSLFKFCLSNLCDFDFSKNKSLEFNECDKYVLKQLQDNIALINNSYETFNFNNIVKTINNHVIDLSSWYFDLIKDSLYCDEHNNARRRTIQTVLYYLLISYTILLQPILCHTCDEVYQFINKPNKKTNILLDQWVDKLDISNISIDENKWIAIFNLKQKVFAKIEQLRNDKIINKSNEAEVYIEFNNKFNIEESLLKTLFNVALVKITNKDSSDIVINLKKTAFIRCERCWNYFPENEIKDGVCKRCHDILDRK